MAELVRELEKLYLGETPFQHCHGYMKMFMENLGVSYCVTRPVMTIRDVLKHNIDAVVNIDGVMVVMAFMPVNHDLWFGISEAMMQYRGCIILDSYNETITMKNGDGIIETEDVLNYVYHEARTQSLSPARALYEAVRYMIQQRF